MCVKIEICFNCSLKTIEPVLSVLNLPRLFSTANKYSFAGYREQKNKKTSCHYKTMNKTSFMTFSMLINVNLSVQVLPLHSYVYSISCLVK